MKISQHIRRLTIVLPAGFLVFAQEAVHVERTPPSSTKQAASPQQKQAEYAKAAALLKQPVRAKKPPQTQIPIIEGEITATVPGDKPIVLPENAIEAIRLESSWHHDAKPLLAPDGSIVYLYGQGQPNIPCAVNRVSTIRLAPGEVLNERDAEIGDNTRWTLTRHQILRAGQVQTFVTVKPQYVGLDTTLTLFTNQRAYNLRLLSDVQGVDQVSFQYPKEEADQAAVEAEKQRAIEAEKQRHEEELRRQQLEASNTDKPITNTDYTVKVGRHAKHLAPILLGDNGAHTLVQLGPAAQHRPLPALQIVSPTGPGAPNVHFDPSQLLFTVDGLFTQARLIVGQGKHSLVVTIKNNKIGA